MTWFKIKINSYRGWDGCYYKSVSILKMTQGFLSIIIWQWSYNNTQHVYNVACKGIATLLVTILMYVKSKTYKSVHLFSNIQ